ncbi:MAG: Rrf2 family transcriptional regulator [Candidatus Roizmanbacteria bacterium]|nr:MAG: Rrf2 family transcriptional regulator [Candidatus Roizmanbacteria bacterium]
MFTINNKSDYALLLVSHISSKKEFIPLSRLVVETKLPKRFIARIAADLARNGILESKEGKDGGYRLMKSLSKISLFDFLRVFEKDLRLVKCQISGYQCDFNRLCTHKNQLRQKIAGIFVNQLTNWTLQDLIKN